MVRLLETLPYLWKGLSLLDKQNFLQNEDAVNFWDALVKDIDFELS